MSATKKRLYSLYEREKGTREWKRISEIACYKQNAVRLFQNQLLAPTLHGLPVTRSLRPVKEA